MRERKEEQCETEKNRDECAEGEIRTRESGEDREKRQQDNGELEQGVADEEWRVKERSCPSLKQC